MLRDVEGLSTEETAAALDLSVPAVKSRLLRARLQLRERLGRFFRRRENGDNNVRVEMVPVKCSEFLQELTNYLDGVLDEPTKVELENHLSWCHNCYVVCDTTKKTIEIYRDSQLYELPDDLRTRLRSAIMTKCQQYKKRGPQSV